MGGEWQSGTHVGRYRGTAAIDRVAVKAPVSDMWAGAGWHTSHSVSRKKRLGAVGRKTARGGSGGKEWNRQRDRQPVAGAALGGTCGHALWSSRGPICGRWAWRGHSSRTRLDLALIMRPGNTVCHHIPLPLGLSASYWRLTHGRMPCNRTPALIVLSCHQLLGRPWQVS